MSGRTERAVMVRPVPRSVDPPARYGELDAYRGLAALAVLVYHAHRETRDAAERYAYAGTPLHDLLRNLDGGVAWFFALSGFVIWLPFARAALTGAPPPDRRDFLRRRALRILPLYLVAVIGVWCLRYAGSPEQWVDLAEHLTFTQVFDQRHIFWTVGPAWSLAVEVWFYVAVAVFGPGAVRTLAALPPAARLPRLLVGTACLGVGCVALKWLALAPLGVPGYWWPVWFGPLARVDGFAVGMALAALAAAPEFRPLGRPLAHGLRWAGLAMIPLAFGLRERDALGDAFFPTLCAAAAGLVMASTVLGPRGSGWERALGHPALERLGLLSYGVYLWHEPILLELGRRGLLLRLAPDAFPANAPILVALSLAAAALTYRFVERPALDLRRPGRSVTPSPHPRPAERSSATVELERAAWLPFAVRPTSRGRTRPGWRRRACGR